MSQQQDSFISLGKQLGEKEQKDKNFNSIINIIDVKMESEEIYKKKEHIESISSYEMEKKSKDSNLIEFYKLALYFKNQQNLKLKKEYRILNDQCSDFQEMIECDNKEMELLENKNKSLFNRVTYLRKIAVDKNIYIYFIEKLFILYNIMLLFMDIYHNKYYSFNFINNMMELSYSNFFIVFIFSVIGGCIYKLRPNVKKFKID